jgi:MarR family transcriptional regulator, organic hydroperoxide resistance regulator
VRGRKRLFGISRDSAVSGVIQSLRRIFKAIQDYSHEVSENFGITGPQLWVLKTISLNGRLSLGDLGGKMYLRPSTITGLIDVLEEKGYLVRMRDRKDRRVVKVQLTPKGQRLAIKAPNPAQGKMIYGLRKLKRHELDLILDSVQKLVKIMEAQNMKVTFFLDR